MTETAQGRAYLRATVIATSIFLAGCGGGGGSEPEAPAPPPPPPPPAGPSITGPLPESVDDTSLAGRDEDTDGIRDDVEVFIAELGLDEDSEALARGYAQSLQSALTLQADSEDAATQALEISDDAALSAICFSQAAGTSDSTLARIEAETLNNQDRMEAFARYDGLLDGSVYTVPQSDRLESLCQGEGARG